MRAHSCCLRQLPTHLLLVAPSDRSFLRHFLPKKQQILLNPFVGRRSSSSGKICGSETASKSIFALPGDSSAGGSGSWSERGEYGPYPWEPAGESFNDESVDWVREDIITLFTTDGIVRIGGSRVPRRIDSSSRRKQRRFREEDYMDPKQSLCLGAVFDIAATNGLDMGRRFCVFGFCRSVEMLSDVIEDAVLEQGGQVVAAAKEGSGDLHEKLSMIVAVPLLWGVPPAMETLSHAIKSGGGIVEKVYYRWEFF